jgi:hypothetical protein
MPDSQGKIITKLRERRQIEAKLHEMVAANSDREFRRQAQNIALMGPQVIPAIVGNLDRADSRLLAAMGTVATFLDRDEAITALRQAVLQGQHTDQGRIGAMTILERFLDESLDDDLLGSLGGPREVAVASLEEVLGHAERNPTVLIEYVQSLDRQDPDVVIAVIQALGDLGGSSPGHMTEPSEDSWQMRRVVEPLRMMAQDVRQEIAAHALQVLGAIRLPEAAKALQTLVPIVGPELRSVAERALRKLRFAGVEVPELPSPDLAWRALLSPVDGMGQQSVWFILEQGATDQARFLNVLLDDRAGAVEAVGHSRVPASLLPPRRPMGSLHDIALPDGSGARLMLEVSFARGRRSVVEALVHNRETQIPVAGVLRLLSPWLWGVGAGEPLPARTLPQLSGQEGNGKSQLAASGRLLGHPAFVSWSLGGEAILLAAEEALRHPGWGLDVWVTRLARELFADPVIAQTLSRRLTAMSEWLLLAGERAWAQLALVSAEALHQMAAEEHPFVQALVRRDLELALHDLEQMGEQVGERSR